MPYRTPIISITAALTLAAATALHAAGEHEGGHGLTFGEPVDDGEPDRIIEIDATDSMDFNPSDVDIQAGEVVRFVVTNSGTLNHSFTIGTLQWHKDHEEQMQGVAPEDIVSHMRHEPNGMVVPPGETRTLSWQFSERGEVHIGCHVPGHFPAGMKGTINVG